MTVKTFVFSPFQENTYLIYNEEKLAILIDPGCFYTHEEKALKTFIDENNLQITGLVNTHLHLDHVFGNAFVEETWQIKASSHSGDEFFLNGFEAQCKMFGLEGGKRPTLPGRYLNEGERISIGKDELQVLHIPGHSPGSIVLYSEAGSFVIAGDVLFSGSIGRTDLQGGNYSELIRGIQEKLLTLPENTVVYPGHGPTTTIGQEKACNPYL